LKCCPPWWVVCLCLPWLWGFLCWSEGRRCEVMEECASGFAGHPRGLFYWLRERIGSGDWLAYVIGIPSGRVFLPNAKGFHWTMFMVLELRIFCGFCAKGQLFSRIWLEWKSRICWEQ
jgi:hypothetical protein